ncbi:MAG TPA: hypothetical protein VFA55_07915 [Candidatus Kapabacteria bacterium]|nr:hypothetical protein [Candidatus Kapabacteria bacterium]
MPEPSTDLHCYSLENVLLQSEQAEITKGYYVLKFYTKDGRLSPEPTDTLSTFFFYPSAGTLRDEKKNIVVYSPKIDMYHKRRFGFPKKSVQ